MSLYDVAEAQRAALLRGERQAASELVHAYGGIWQRMQALLDDLLRQKAEAEARGLVVDDGWLFRYNRLETLQRQAEAELRVFIEFADPLITRQQWQATNAALDDTEALTREALARQEASVSVIWNRLPKEALADLIGFTANGSPLRSLLDELGPDASAAVRDTLLRGVALGWNPNKVGREMRQALGGNLVRALRISRTETLRAYREATLRSYTANSDVIDGWVWLSAATPRTCAACWALHGTVHPLSERQRDHINGRCTSYAHFRFGEQPVTVTPGVEQFAKLDPDTQDAILGKASGLAYRAGAFKLEDVVGWTHSPDWGPTIRVKGLRELLGEEDRQKWMGKVLERKQALQTETVPSTLVGKLGQPLAKLLATRSEARTVHVATKTVAHYRDKHAGQFDIGRAEAILQDVVADPIRVYQGKKANTLVFVGEFDAEHYLLAPIKVFPEQLWLESLYIDTKRKFERRKWVQDALLYQKGK